MKAANPWLAALLAAAFLFLVAPRGSAQLLGIDLSGTWVINYDLSDDPHEVIQKKMREMHAGRHGFDGGMRGGGGEWGGGGWGAGPGRYSPPGGRGGEDMPRLQPMHAPPRIVILQDDQSITMIPEGRDTLRIVPDGKKRKIKTPLGEMEVKGEWKGLSLVLTTKSPNGHQITRTYRINDDGRLEVVTTVELPTGDKVEIAMRYDDMTSP